MTRGHCTLEMRACGLTFFGPAPVPACSCGDLFHGQQLPVLSLFPGLVKWPFVHGPVSFLRTSGWRFEKCLPAPVPSTDSTGALCPQRRHLSPVLTAPRQPVSTHVQAPTVPLSGPVPAGPPALQTRAARRALWPLPGGRCSLWPRGRARRTTSCRRGGLCAEMVSGSKINLVSLLSFS